MGISSPENNLPQNNMAPGSITPANSPVDVPGGGVAAKETGRVSRLKAKLARLWPQKPRQRKIMLAAACLALVAAAALVFRYYRQGGAGGEWQTAVASLTGITVTVSAGGTVEPEQSLNLSFKNPGTIKVVAVRQGDEVKEGQLLLAQDDAEQQVELTSAQANLRSAVAQLARLQNGSLPEEIEQLRWEEKSARSALENAARQLERIEQLYAAEAATAKELDDARYNYDTAYARWQQAVNKLKLTEAGARAEEIEQAKAAVEAARARVRQAELSVEATQLKAPFDGIVAEVNATVGQRVTGVTVSGADNTNRPLLSIVSKKLRVRAQVNEADIGQVAVGQKATFTVNAFPERRFSARVTAISPQAITISNVQFYEVILEIDGNPSGLKAGMPCNVEIVTAAKEQVVAVPRQAISFASSYLARTGMTGAGGSAASRQAGDQAGTGSRERQSHPAGQQAGPLATGGTGNTGSGEQGSAGSRNTRAGASSQGTREGRSAAGEAQGSAGGAAEQVNRTASGEGRRAVVLVLKNGRVEVRRVQTGIMNSQLVEIVSGLEPGEVVITGQAGSTTTSNQGSRSTGGTTGSTRNPGFPLFMGPPPGGGGR